MFNRETNKSRGFGFVVFDHESSVDRSVTHKKTEEEDEIVATKNNNLIRSSLFLLILVQIDDYFFFTIFAWF